MFLNFLSNISASDTVSGSEPISSAAVSSADAAGGDFFANVNVDPGRFVEMLPKLAMGMVSIFIVIGVIIIATSLLNKIFSRKNKKAE